MVSFIMLPPLILVRVANVEVAHGASNYVTRLTLQNVLTAPHGIIVGLARTLSGGRTCLSLSLRGIHDGGVTVGEATDTTTLLVAESLVVEETAEFEPAEDQEGEGAEEDRAENTDNQGPD